MKLRNFKYYFKEATKSVFKSDWMSLASIFSVVASLLVFGLFMVLSVNLNHFANQLEGDYEIVLVVDENYAEEEITALKSVIEEVPNVAEATLDRKEDRLLAMREEFGDNAFLLDGYEEDNPLRDWYKVTLTDLTLSSETADTLTKIPGIVKIIRNQDTIDKLVSMTSYMDRISLWVMIALALISVFIISNTIKLTVHSRRREINIMKFVGATDWFIRWPFIIEGIIIGFFGAALSLLIICYGYSSILGWLSGLEISFVSFKPLGEIFWQLFGLFLLMGAGLGGVGSFMAVRKHLNV